MTGSSCLSRSTSVDDTSLPSLVAVPATSALDRTRGATTPARTVTTVIAPQHETTRHAGRPPRPVCGSRNAMGTVLLLWNRYFGQYEGWPVHETSSQRDTAGSTNVVNRSPTQKIYTTTTVPSRTCHLLRRAPPGAVRLGPTTLVSTALELGHHNSL